MIYPELFFSFLKVGLFSIGGGYAAMPLIQSIVVSEKAWLNIDEFSNLVTIAEMTPGPIVINGATFVGMRVAGFSGAICATLGSIFPSLIIVSLLSVLYYRYKQLSAMQTVLKSIRPAVVALIASAGLTILINAVFGTAGIALSAFDLVSALLFILSFIAIRKFKFNPIITLILCGALFTAVNILIEHLG